MAVVVKNTIPNLVRATKAVKRTLPRKIANVAKNHFLEGFKRGGRATDDSLGGWAERKKADKNKKRRAILVKSGDLERDVDVRKTTFEEIVLGTKDVAYGEYHNEPEDEEKMPKREFLGDSQKLNRKVIKLVNRELDGQFKR